MRRSSVLMACPALLVSACFYNPTIEEEVSRKCGISVKAYQKAEAALDAGADGQSIRAGRCRLTRTSKGVIEGVVTR